MHQSTTQTLSFVTSSDRLVNTKQDALAPLRWLRSGLQDFRMIPGLGIFYGSLFTAAGLVVAVLTLSVPWYTLAYLTGLVMIGPFLASGLYAASRDITYGIRSSITNSFCLLRQRATYLALFSLTLSLVMAAWVRFTALAFAIRLNAFTPPDQALQVLLTTAEGLGFIGFMVGVGFLLVSVIFVISAVSIPLILDRDVNFITAVQTSYQAVKNNPAAMSVWALIIVMLTALGVATFFLGFIFIFPLLGFATWHSYRELTK